MSPENDWFNFILWLFLTKWMLFPFYQIVTNHEFTNSARKQVLKKKILWKVNAYLHCILHRYKQRMPYLKTSVCQVGLEQNQKRLHSGGLKSGRQQEDRGGSGKQHLLPSIHQRNQ